MERAYFWPNPSRWTVPLKALFMSPIGYFENIARTKVPVYIHFTYIHIYAGNTVCGLPVRYLLVYCFAYCLGSG